jgi:hypothetical protein
MDNGEPAKPIIPAQNRSESLPQSRVKSSREEEAERALTSTSLATGACTLIVTLFLLTISLVPVVQLVTGLRGGNLVPLPDLFRALPNWANVSGARSLVQFWNLLPSAEELKSAEEAMENQSVVSRWLRSRIQGVLTGFLHAGTEQVYPGRNGWLFYRPDVDYVTGPPFLDLAQLSRRARERGIQPDPIRAIVDFRNQLALRGIDLIIMPVPSKATIDGEMLASYARGDESLQNASFADFKLRLEKEGVRVFDPAPLLMERKAAVADMPLYLQTDTHWRPETMEFVARRLASLIGSAAPPGRSGCRIREGEITGCGDLLTMLSLPQEQTLYGPQKITIEQVLGGNMQWRANKAGQVLLLGDSFCNIYSLGAMGWGESAGFAEHLSYAMAGQPLDCIVRNSDAAFATREILSRELAHGRDRLSGKKLVVWEFAVRELMFGNWKLLDMKIGESQVSHFLTLQPGEQAVVTGTVEAVSPVPLPGTVPYKDHILTVQIVDITGPQERNAESLQAVVCLQSMRENVWTPAARLRPGDRITVNLRAWVDVSAQYEKINRSDINDTVLQLEEPVWGELIN